MADAAGLDFDSHVAWTGIGDVAFDNFQGTAGARDLHCSHSWHEFLQ
jgi:hypothetical protein